MTMMSTIHLAKGDGSSVTGVAVDRNSDDENADGS